MNEGRCQVSVTERGERRGGGEGVGGLHCTDTLKSADIL